LIGDRLLRDVGGVERSGSADSNQLFLHRGILPSGYSLACTSVSSCAATTSLYDRTQTELNLIIFCLNQVGKSINHKGNDSQLTFWSKNVGIINTCRLNSSSTNISKSCILIDPISLGCLCQNNHACEILALNFY
jgi:hypothetical protein